MSTGVLASGADDAVAQVQGATASLLWAACRPEPDPTAVAHALSAGADLERAATVALAQRVAPLLWRAIGSSGLRSTDRPCTDGVRRDAMRWLVFAERMLPRAVMTALTPLREAGLEPLVLKGAALVDRYPEARLRPMDDVDIFLPAEHHPAALKALRRAGWQEVIRTGHHYEVVMTHPDVPGLPVELHRALSTWRDGSSRLSGNDLWQRRTPQAIAGVPAFGLEPEDELVMLGSHAAKPFHSFSRLLWSVDMAVVVHAAASAGRPIDWQRVADVADESSARTAVAVGLAQAQRLGASSPDWLRDPPATGARRAALQPLLSPDWPLVERDVGVRTRLRYALIDSRRTQLMLLVDAVTAEGPRRTPALAIGTAVRAVRRWWRLRRGSTARS